MLLVEGTRVSPTELVLLAGSVAIGYMILVNLVLPYFSEAQKYINQTPWVGVQKEWFARYKAGHRSIRNSGEMFSEGYNKYNKKSLPFILPQLNSQPLVTIPQSMIAEIMALPDSKYDPHKVLRESISADYTVPLVADDHLHIDVVRRQLTRKLPLLTESVYTELKLSIGEQWPTKPNEWSTFNVYPTAMRIVSRAANRVFGGKELCRNPEFIDASREYTVAVFSSGARIRLFPEWLRGYVAPYLLRKFKVAHHFNTAKRVALPIIHQRIKDIETGTKKEENIDAMQWLVEDCVALAKSKNDSSILDDDAMVARVLQLNMVAIHTTSMVSTNTLTDICSSPRSKEIIDGIREEVERVLQENGGVFTKHAINDMHRVDSAIRESMRHTGLSDGGLRREVVAKDGITLSNGVHLPYGTRTNVAASEIHHDADFYGADAKEYDAFRFSRPREEYLAQIDVKKADPAHLKAVLEQKNQSLVAVRDDFISFGYGRHACPGRFFASQEIKLFIAHTLMKYDIMMEPDQPAPIAINGSRIPNPMTEIKIQPR